MSLQTSPASLTRRHVLGAASAAVLNGQTFERIDTHMHIHRHSAELISMLEKTGWRGLTICDSREVGDEASVLQEMIRGTIEAHRESNGRLAWATTFDAREFERLDFAARTVAGLRHGFQQGAIAVKIWKNVGMGIRSKGGEYLLPDHPALHPIYEAVQKSGKTLIAHLADLDIAWRPIEPGDPDGAYYRNHPEWVMYGKPGAPSKAAILEARDRILARYPRLRVIGCHLGSNEQDLPTLAQRLDRFPNFAVDLAARVRFLVRADRASVREFLTRYADRVLYATDFTLGADDVRGAESVQATHQREWDFFSRDLPLPEPVLHRIFHDNALRWLPGIAK